MIAYPIADTPEAALAPDAALARTAEDAETIVAGPVYLASVELAGVYPSLEIADAAFDGALYGDPRLEPIWRGDGWRIVVRFWRPAPPAPVGRTPAIAVRKPLGYARTPEEARAILGAPAERVSEPLSGATYATRARALGRASALVEQGHAQIVERAGRFVALVTYWRPIASKLAPAERAEIAARVAAPMRANTPQATIYIGLFERLAPENAAIVLAEEGDGRTHGE